MKLFGKKPVALLAVGSFALAMTSCKQMSATNKTNAAKTEAPVGQAWAELIEKISKTLRGGFGGENQLDSVRRRNEDNEDSGVGG